MSIELIRKPTLDEVELIIAAAEEAARKRVLSKIPLKRLSDLDVTVEAEGDKPLTVEIEVAIEFESGEEVPQSLVDEATSVAFLAAEAKVRELNLCRDTPS
jgi:hypothetical protein